MTDDKLLQSIEGLQKELNQLTDGGKADLSSKTILQLSTQLDNLIVRYIKETN